MKTCLRCGWVDGFHRRICTVPHADIPLVHCPKEGYESTLNACDGYLEPSGEAAGLADTETVGTVTSQW